MTEDDDDWMCPRTSHSWSRPQRPDGVVYLIQRKRRIPVSGNVAFIEQWDEWAEFPTREERDAELQHLRATTSWHLRGRQAHYIGGQIVRMPDPGEYMDV